MSTQTAVLLESWEKRETGESNSQLQEQQPQLTKVGVSMLAGYHNWGMMGKGLAVNLNGNIRHLRLEKMLDIRLCNLEIESCPG